jgi:hypothetical protein
MKTSCPACGQNIEAEEQWAGMMVNCPTCNHEFSLPMINPPSGDEPKCLIPPLGDKAKSEATRSVKTSHVLIVCGTILAGIWIWKASGTTQPAATSNTAVIQQNTDTSQPQPAPEPTPAQTTRAVVQNVVNQDRQLTDTWVSQWHACAARDGSDAQINELASIVRNYVANAKGINTDNCPRDFAEAYYRCLTAFDGVADTLQNHPHVPESFAEGFVEGAIKGIQGDYSGGMNDAKAWMSQFQGKLDYAKSLHAEFEALAVRYDAHN